MILISQLSLSSFNAMSTKTPGLQVMNDCIISIYLSESSMGHFSRGSAQLKLECFIHHNKKIQCIKLLSHEEEGIIVLAVIEEKEYALKMISQSDML